MVGDTSFAGSMTVPTDTKKIGISSAEPKNSMCSMISLSLGTSRLMARPAKNAPTIGSMPTADATAEPVSRTATANV